MLGVHSSAAADGGSGVSKSGWALTAMASKVMGFRSGWVLFEWTW